MLFRCCERIKTVKILECFEVDAIGMFKLQLKMTNGKIKHEIIEQQLALRSYHDIFRNHKDVNILHNLKILNDNNIREKNTVEISMHENPYEGPDCRIC